MLKCISGIVNEGKFIDILVDKYDIFIKDAVIRGVERFTYRYKEILYI